METRTLGGGLEVSALGLGCMGMSEFYGARDDAEATRVLERAVELGVSFFDTADMYGPYHNEELLGRFLAARRPRAVIATKFGIVRKPGEYARTIDNSPEYARASCEASLRRLGVERIDLYYVHRVDAGQPVEEVMGALADLVTEGKIGHIGLCEVSAATLRRAHAVHPVTAVQTEYSLWTRDVEGEVLPVCRELGVAFVPYSPLGRGFLTGTYGKGQSYAEGDFRAALPRFQEDNLAANLAIVEAVKAMAEEKGCTPAQLALAWLLAQGKDIVPIPGTRRVRYLEENVAASSVRLSEADVAGLARTLEALPVSGGRYTEEGMKGVNV
ncbi:aldo/keto reductase [Rhodobacteraceae bacterium DSL-40]|uniref:aldo/keto reductase n=1 Tax=Amaricoccus sp. B4 TaxID=3368557 RepID=UPI000DABE386